jgi:hypothetical protein
MSGLSKVAIGVPRKKNSLHSWEETTIDILQRDPRPRDLVYDDYLTADLHGYRRRFASSSKYAAVPKTIGACGPNARDILNVPAGDGIATYAIVRLGFNVVALWRKSIPRSHRSILYPNAPESLATKIYRSVPSRIPGLMMPKSIVLRLGIWQLKRSKRPNRVYSFVALAR